MEVVRFLDVALLIMTTPIALLLGAPALGFLLAAGGWVLQRVAQVAIERYAKGAEFRREVLMNLGGMFFRLWLVVVAIVVAGVAGSRSDGRTAAVTVLAAFTIYLVLSIIGRPAAGGSKRA